MSSTGSDEEDSRPKRDPREDQALAGAVEQAIKAIAAGQSAASVESIAAGNLPAHLREHFKQMLRAQLAKRGMAKAQAGKAAVAAEEKKSPALRGMFALIAKQALDRILSVIRSRPDVAQTVKQAGKTLAAHGVTPDMARVSEAELGRIAPTPGLPGQQQDQEKTR